MSTPWRSRVSRDVSHRPEPILMTWCRTPSSERGVHLARCATRQRPARGYARSCSIVCATWLAVTR